MAPVSVMLTTPQLPTRIMPFLTVLHKIRTQSGTPACSPTATAEMLSHTALRRWIPFLGSRPVILSGLDEGSEPVSWKTDAKVHSTHKAEGSLTVANTVVLPFTLNQYSY